MINLKNKKLIAVFVLLAIAIVGGVFVLGTRERVQQVVQGDSDKIVDDEKEKINDMRKKDETDNDLDQIIDLNNLSVEEVKFKKEDYKEWKTYRNKEYGFEVKYPGNDWSYWDKNNSNPESFGNKDIVVFGYKYPGEGDSWIINFPLKNKQVTKQDIINAIRIGTKKGESKEDACLSISVDKLKKVSFNGFDALSVECFCGYIKSNFLFLYTNKGIFIFDGEHRESFNVDFQKFYSSFKFINF